MNIVLTGPMGVGKTSVGKKAARMLGREFIDTDSIIGQRSGHSIRELFAMYGEQHFRGLEKAVIKDISTKDQLVIATGGGAVLTPENMKSLRSNGVIIALEAPARTLLERLKRVTDRPLIASAKIKRDYLIKYLDERAVFYSNSDFKIETGTMGIQAVAERICAIASMPFVRICGCISGRKAHKDIRTAIENGASMVELRLDLISNPNIRSLVKTSSVPVIATDRKNKENLKEAIRAGCDFVDIEIDSSQREGIIRLARERGCKVIVSFHDFEGVPDAFPEKCGADLLKIAVTVNSTEDLKKLMALHNQREDVIIVGMGPRGIPLRVFSPLLGSYLTYCSIGEKTAPGQLSLKTMKKLYKEMGLR
jgi:shikimate kinase